MQGLVWTFFRNDLKSGDIRLLLIALTLAVAVVSGLTGFIDRLEQMLVGESSQFLAADRVLKSTRPISPEWQEKANRYNLDMAEYLSFRSMLYVGDEPKLVSVKAASDNYPLRGQLKYRLAPGINQPIQETVDGPLAGEVWLERRLFDQLGINVGDTVDIGDASLKVSAELVSEPDRGVGFLSMGPRVLMHLDDVEETGVVQFGSRVSYYLLFAGVMEDIQDFEAGISEALEDYEKWIDLETTQPTVSVALERAKRFFKLASSIVLLLAFLTIAMATTRFTKRHIHNVAVMKTLGANSRYIRFFYSSLFFLVVLVAVLLGWLLAYIGQVWVLDYVSVQLEVDIPPMTYGAYLLGLLTAMVALCVFIFPPLFNLSHVSVLNIFRIDKDALQPFTLVRLLVMILGMMLLLFAFTQQVLSALILALAVIVVVLLVMLPAYGLIRMSTVSGASIASWYLLALSSIQRRLTVNAVYVAVFAISLMLAVVLVGARDSLFQEWKEKLPPETPNFFLVNIQESEIEGVQQWIANQQIKSEPLYPMIRGRLVKINDELVRDIVSKEDLKRAGADRELNLSWALELPPDNEIIEGQWWQNESETGVVSVEKELAERMNIQLGDKLTYLISAEEMTATVTSIREVDWDRMRPNFYMLFTKPQLEQFHKTFMTSFWLPEQQHGLVADFLKEYPTTIIIELDAVIKQIRTIVSYVSLALQFVLALVILGSLLTLLTTIQSSLEARERENALIRTLGGSRKLILGALALEFASIGFLAGCFASFGAEVLLLVIQAKVMNMDLQLHPELWWIAPVVGSLLIGIAGVLASRKVVNVAPQQLLRAL